MAIEKHFLERANVALEYWDEDNLWRRLILRDLKDEDEEALEFHLNESESERSTQEAYSRDFETRLLENDLLTVLSTDNWPLVPLPRGVDR